MLLHTPIDPIRVNTVVLMQKPQLTCKQSLKFCHVQKARQKSSLCSTGAKAFLKFRDWGILY
jgi:hypothetical protein